MSDVEKRISELWGKQIKKDYPELINLEDILNHLSLRNRLKNMFAKTKPGDLMGNVSLVDGHIDEPKMTDEEIIKALEYCARSMGAEACKGCPFSEKDICDNEDNAPQKYALNLIKRKDAEIDILKAEIERLKAEIVIRDKIIDERGKEVIRHDNAIRSLHKQLDNLKAEAYKEFKERLKEMVGEVNSMKINILGTPYTIKECSPDEDTYLKDCDGYCDKTSKTICITTKKPEHDDDVFDVYIKKVMRHEIIHAFMNESGLQENFEHPNRYGHDETTIDWFAIQFPKLLDAFKEAKCLE